MVELSPAALLDELVRIPSVSSMSNRPVVEFARGILAARGWHVRELPYWDAHGVEKVNAMGVPPSQRADDFAVELAFVCHTDTVPYAAAWAGAVDPAIHDGALHGCGACDVKGFLACLLAMAARVRPEQFAHTVALVLTAEEEIGCIGAKRLLAGGMLRARHVVVGEPTSLRPARAGKGYGLAEVRVVGTEAHSAHPAQGVSAIAGAARLIGRIEQLAARLREQGTPRGLFDPPYTTINIGTIAGGTAKNIVPGECRFLLEWRPLPGEKPGAVADAVRRIAQEMGREDASFRCEIEMLREQAGFETREDSALLRRWTELTGHAAIGVPFGTEAPLFAQLSDDVVVLGPGDMRTAHSEREQVPLAELDACAEALQALVTHPFEAGRL